MKTSGAVGGTRLELGAGMLGGLLMSMRGSGGAERVEVAAPWELEAAAAAKSKGEEEG